MDVIESKGKTVDEAVFSGLLKMDLSIDEVDIEILDEGGGLFKSARVRMTKKKDADMPGKVEMFGEKQEEEPVREAPRYEAGSPKSREDFRGGDARREAPRHDGPRHDGPRRDYPRRDEGRHDNSQRPRSYEQRPERRYEESMPAVPQDPQNDAEKFLYGLFERMGMSVALKSTNAEDDILRIDMSGRAMGMLIGRRGETLDALQYLTSLVLNNGKESYMKVMLDTENYRKKREEALKHLAVRLADKVIKSGKRVVLEPMNPYERRILHATLQDHPGITTYSEGEDPFRSVVVALKGKEDEKADEE
jgi:spoIIIJ-associated protein